MRLSTSIGVLASAIEQDFNKQISQEIRRFKDYRSLAHQTFHRIN